MSDRAVLRCGIVYVVLACAWSSGVGSAAEPPVIEVYQEASCDCCTPWVKYLEAAGFTVKVTAFEDPMALQAVKREHGISPELAACHTARVDGYLIEGHVSAQEIRWLLKERPNLKGLVVPRMPKGAPGMEGPQSQRYEVLALDPAGGTSVFAVHEPAPAPDEQPAPAPEQ